MKKAIFLDRDGVIIEDSGYIENIEDIYMFPFTIEALKKLKNDFELFIVTNQAGIGKGLITEQGVKKVNQYILDELKKHNININQLYCCPHKKEDNCNCRKPKSYFILQAQKDFDIDIKNSYVIGDHPSDIDFALKVGATGIYVLTGHGKKHFNDLKQRHKEIIVDSLKEAVDYILNKNK